MKTDFIPIVLENPECGGTHLPIVLVRDVKVGEIVETPQWFTYDYKGKDPVVRRLAHNKTFKNMGPFIDVDGALKVDVYMYNRHSNYYRTRHVPGVDAFLEGFLPQIKARLRALYNLPTVE